MPHNLVLTVLAVTEAATLLVGLAAAETVAAHSPALMPVTSQASPGAAAAAEVTVAQPVAVTRPAPSPTSKPRPSYPVSRQRRVHRTPPPAPRRMPAPAARQTSRPPQELMEQATARIPGYQPGGAVWFITSRYGHWGVADLGMGVIYINPDVPAARMYDVVAHEWSHVLSVKAYDGDINTALDEMNRWFDGSGMAGAERAADCMAIQLGARWTHYTSCHNPNWRAGARRLLARERL